MRPPATDAGLKLAVHRAAPRRVREVDPVAADLIERSERLADLAQQRLGLAPTSSPARERARQLRDHLEGFVRPRAADIEAPLIVLLLGPTGAGKSSLLNTIAGAEVSKAGVLRPTTREAVLYASESDAKHILSGDRLRLIAGDRIIHVPAPESSSGVAVIDAPDIDSVERDNRELADVLLEVSDLCVFVTTATRYADLVPWQVLRRAQERGLPLVVMLNRVPGDARDRDVVLADARRLLSEAGMNEADETLDLIAVTEGDIDPNVNGLARETVRQLLDRIAQLTTQSEERRSVAMDALAGAVRGLAPLVHAVADDLEHEAIDAEALRRIAETAYADELAKLSRDLRGGVLLRQEVLRRWHDFVGADQVTRFIASGLGRLRGLLLTAFRGTPTAPVAVGVAVMLGVFAHTAGLTGAELGIAAGTAYLNQKLLEALFGERAMEQLIEQARARLEALLASLFAAERERFDALAPRPAALHELAVKLRASVSELR